MDIREALKWYLRYSSVKKNTFGIDRNGTAIVVSFDIDAGSLMSMSEFQRKGVSEHERLNCWTSSTMVRAQINTPVKVRLVPESLILSYI